jgi:DNA-binding CsgD family transcriptional regulator
MLDTFAATYPARWSWPAKLLLPAVHPMTLVRAIHLGLMFPLGIASFVFLVVTLAVGGALIWTLIGPIVLLVGLYVSRWFGDLEAWRVRHIVGIELRRPPTGIERGQSFRQQVWTRLIDPSTWTGLIYLLVQFPIGIAMFVGLTVGGAVAGAFIAAPFVSFMEVGNTGVEEAVRVSIDLGFWSTSLTEPGEIALALVPVGILVYFLLVHAINIATALHASWARLMLGSRADPIALAPAGPPPPDGQPDEPPPEGDAAPPEAPAAPNGELVAPVLEESVLEEPMPSAVPVTSEPASAPPEPAPPPGTVVDEPDAPVVDVPGIDLPEIDLPDEYTAPRVLEPAARLREPLATESPADQLVPELSAPLLVATDEPLDALTNREREVLTLIARGYSNAAIAETFVISEGTVKTHVKRVLAKLGLRDRTQAAIYAYETNFVLTRDETAVPELQPIVLTRNRAR